MFIDLVMGGGGPGGSPQKLWEHPDNLLAIVHLCISRVTPGVSLLFEVADKSFKVPWNTWSKMHEFP